MQSREHFTDIGYKPFLFYVVFGVTGDDIHPSGSRHHVDELPESLEIHALSRPDHADYMDGFFSGDLGKVLKASYPDLYEKCLAAENCVIIKGQIKEDSSLDYMRNVIGIIQALFEEGAAGVLDCLTFTLYSDQDWEEHFLKKRSMLRTM